MLHGNQPICNPFAVEQATDSLTYIVVHPMLSRIIAANYLLMYNGIDGSLAHLLAVIGYQIQTN